jgi:hypothetical protein
LYNLNGQETLLTKAKLKKNRQLIVFPAAAKEVKAQWFPIDDSQRSRYLSRVGTGQDGKTHTYGLVALHILTKDLPNWFWADFSHIDCEAQPPVNACANNEAAQTPLVDSTTNGPNGTGTGPSGSNGVRNETIGTVWSNYRLRGTQTNFTLPDGEATILSNPVIEATFQHSSCITCHAMAAIGPRSRDINGNIVAETSQSPVDRLDGSGDQPPLGTPNPTLFGADPMVTFGQGPIVEYLQTDFLWSPFLARFKKQQN